MMNDKLTLKPTRLNMWTQLDNLVTFANSNKTKQVKLFISYSGHGSNQVDKNGDEADGTDETLCPLDFEQNGFIVDDELRSRFIDRLPANTSVIFISDSCHSGTILDLKYNYTLNNKHTVTSAKDTVCNVYLISGCRDNQTSADASFQTGSKWTHEGAMTHSFLASYDASKSCQQIVLDMRTWLKQNQYTQVPQLSSGKLVDVSNEHFF
jgi:hypothetical protein